MLRRANYQSVTEATAPAEAEAATEAAPEEAAPETAANDNAEVAETQTADNTQAEAAPEVPAESADKAPERPTSVQLAELTKRAAIAERIEKRSQSLAEEAARRLRAAEEREAALARREQELLEGDELALLEKAAKARGVDLATLIRRGVQRVANDGKLAPEEEAKVKEEQRERELRELKEWRLSQEKREAEREAQREREQQERQVQTWQNETVAAARESKDSLPFLSDLPDHVVAHRAAQVAGAYFQKTGELPERSDLLSYLEAQEKAEVERSAELHMSRLRRLGKLPTIDEVVSSGPGTRKPATQDTGPAKAARTLTNSGAAQRPANGGGRPMTERERIEYAAQAIPDFPL